MYRKKHNEQASIYDFILPFGGHLKKDNRWVVLREMIDWATIEEEYSKNFDSNGSGPDGYPSDVAFGSLYIQRKLRFTDRELVDQIAENPYMQYFLGYKEYVNEKPFDPSLLVHFRKRLLEETMNRIIEKMFIDKADNNTPSAGGGFGGNSLPEQGLEETDDPKPEGSSKSLNRGTLIIDASCAPADIAYPTDLELCDKARKCTEVILDHYWKLYGSVNGRKEKPRTYREVARKRLCRNMNKVYQRFNQNP